MIELSKLALVLGVAAGAAVGAHLALPFLAAAVIGSAVAVVGDRALAA